MISASLVKELRESTGSGMLDCKKALEANNGDIQASIDWLREKGISKAAKKSARIAAEGIAAIKVKDNEAVIVEVNSETDFVAKNDEFLSLVDSILDAILSNNVATIDDVLALSFEEGTISDLIIAKTSKIGEKLSLRRFEKISKTDTESFGKYIHGAGKIAVLTLVDNASDEAARDIAMHAAAMRPEYVKIENVPASVIAKEEEILKEQAINEGKPAEIAEKMVKGRINKFYKENCLEEQQFVKNPDLTVKAFVAENGGTIVNMVRFEVGEGMEKRTENFAEEVAKQIEAK